MKNYYFGILSLIIFISGCSTAQSVENDTSDISDKNNSYTIEKCFSNDGMYLMNGERYDELVKNNFLSIDEFDVISFDSKRLGANNTEFTITYQAESLGLRLKRTENFKLFDDCVMYYNSWYNSDGESQFDPNKIIPPIGSGDYYNEKTFNNIEASVVDIISLVSEFKENQAKADKEYKNMRVLFTGVVDIIKKEDLNDVYILKIKTDKWYHTNCYIDPSSIDKLTSVNKGDKLSINGWIKNYQFGELNIQYCNIQ